MTIYRTLETDGVPAPSDFELEAPDQHNGRMTFAQYCDAVAIYGPSRDLFREDVERGIDRMEMAGIHIPEPLRLNRWAWYQRWNAVLARDECETALGARNAGTW